MRNKKSFLGLVLIVAVLLLGVGYSISVTELVVTSNVGATPNDSQFNVHFVEGTTITPTVLSANKTTDDGTKVVATASVVGPLAAKLDVSNLWAKGDNVEVIYPIINESTDLSANLTVKICSDAQCTTELTKSGENYVSGDYLVSATLDDDSIAHGGNTNVTVTAVLNKTPIDSNIDTLFYVVVFAEPVTP